MEEKEKPKTLNLVPKIQERKKAVKTLRKADKVLDRNVGRFQDVLVLGWDHDGDFAWDRSDSVKQRRQLLELIEILKVVILENL